jgi:hypothetical protein
MPKGIPKIKRKLPCEHCGIFFTPKGIKNHEKACASKESEQSELPHQLSLQQQQAHNLPTFTTSTEDAVEDSHTLLLQLQLYKSLVRSLMRLLELA